MKYILSLIALLFITGCYRVGHQDFIKYKNNIVGKKIMPHKKYRYENVGKIIRGDFLVGGQGLTHITNNKNGDYIFHIESNEILPHFDNKEWVGKCKIYYIVDSKTKIIKTWGFDKGGNPKSCRTWS